MFGFGRLQASVDEEVQALARVVVERGSEQSSRVKASGIVFVDGDAYVRVQGPLRQEVPISGNPKIPGGLARAEIAAARSREEADDGPDRGLLPAKDSFESMRRVSSGRGKQDRGNKEWAITESSGARW